MIRSAVFLSLLALAAVAATSSAWAQFSPEQSYTIPTDSRARYTNIAIEGQGRYRKITTRRTGPSGVGYSLREYDCERARVRYLATGDTQQELKNPRPDKWASVVDGSIASYIGGQACHTFRAKAGGRK